MKYQSKVNYKQRKSLILRVRIFALMIFAIALAGGVLFYLKYVREQAPASQTSSVSQVTVSREAPNINVFRTPYFQFQAKNTWAEVPRESTANKFVYRSTRNSLVEHDMTIYVNETPEDIKPTNVLKVIPDGRSSFEVQEVSKNCGEGLDKNQQIKDVQVVTFSDVTFLCYGKISQYNVIFGEVGGDTDINLERQDDSKAIYSIYYRDLRANPGPDEVIEIAKTFQAR